MQPGEEILLLEPENVRSMIPAEILENPRGKGKTPANQGFAVKLWELLQWAGNDTEKKRNVGCGWIDNSEFFIEKPRFCEIMQYQLNTLNFKLRSCKFTQARTRNSSMTFWKCDNFLKNSNINDIIAVDDRRAKNDNCPTVSIQALSIPLLEKVRVYSQSQSEIPKLKTEVIFLWEEIVEYPSVWACEIRTFLENATLKFCHSYSRSGGGDTYMYDAQQTQFSQYIASNNLQMQDVAYKMISYVLTHSSPNAITISEFCSFFARFGPEDCLLEKIHQLLCCSKAYHDWFRPGEQIFDQTKHISGSYSNTFSNCFIIKRSQGSSYHVYNQPFAQPRMGFLVDETGKAFITWHSVFESISLPQQSLPYNYGGFETMGFDQTIV